jgi:hypothetical protein
MFIALSVVQQIVAVLKGSSSEEAKFLSVANIIFNLMKQNDK